MGVERLSRSFNFEDHRLLMKNSPVIFHKDMCPGRKNRSSDIQAGNWHENLEILRINGGSGVALSGKSMFHVSGGDVVVVNANDPHGVLSEGRPLVYDCIIFDRNFATKNGVDTNSLIFEKYIKNNAELNSLVDRLWAAMESAERIEINAHALNLLAELYKNYRVNQSPEKAQTDSDISNAVIFISTNLHRRITLEEMAAAAGLSKYHFSRKFKEVMQISPFVFLTRQRCELAKILLISTTQPVCEVAVQAGFENAAYFSKIFSAQTGMTPTEYRKSQQ